MGTENVLTAVVATGVGQCLARFSSDDFQSNETIFPNF